jgi:hypothetical protein
MNKSESLNLDVLFDDLSLEFSCPAEKCWVPNAIQGVMNAKSMLCGE